MKAPIVILGSGLAGTTVLRELRKLDKSVPVIVVTADDGAFYSKPSLSNALAAGKTSAQLAINSAEQLSIQLNAEFRTATTVERILPDQHGLLTSQGRIEYGKLVIALGAHPIRVPLDGSAAEEALSVNNLTDYAHFRKQLNGAKHVAIMGAGLIGCEFANDLAIVGIKSTVFDRSPQALGRLLPEGCAAFFGEKLESIGVLFNFETTLGMIEREGASLTVIDSHGRKMTADLVLSAVGLKPATELAQEAGIAVNRGIVVNRQLATSDPDIHALGDCAEVEGLVLPFVMPIMQCARTLAKILAGSGDEVSYPAMPVAVKTPACPTVICPPPMGADGAWQETISATGVRAVFKNVADEVLGFALLGDAMHEKQVLAATMPAWL